MDRWAGGRLAAVDGAVRQLTLNIGATRGKKPGKSLFDPVPLLGLRDRRIKASISSDDAAALIGLSNRAHYHKIEKGIVRLDICRARVLAEALGCSIENLF